MSAFSPRCRRVIFSDFQLASNWVAILLCALERRLVAALEVVAVGEFVLKIHFWVTTILKSETHKGRNAAGVAAALHGAEAATELSDAGRFHLKYVVISLNPNFLYTFFCLF